MNFVDKDGTTKVYIPVHPCCCRLARICVLKKICAFMDTRSPKAKASPRRSAGLSSGTASAFAEPGDVCSPITSKTPVKVYHGHGGDANA